MSIALDESKVIGEQKRSYVRDMFARIAPRYDLLNSLLSLRIHHYWRNVAAREANLQQGDTALDVCTGTADLAVRLARDVGTSGTVIGVDFCEPMLRLGWSKARKRSGQRQITLVLGDALQLPFASGSFQAVTVAFGIRNVVDIRKAFAEMWRVLKPGGRVVCLEFSRPRRQPFRAIYHFYFHRLLPGIGGLFSHRDAYTYLPTSVQYFPEREQLAHIMREVGFTAVTWRELTMGIVCIHSGVKP
ncbi:MAG: bifunctional demethylmenaquinone methyltransferase/2-methoxy-6-polyprenyl-1,4-benzoquinol methylase UbiE [Armatimonadota bacterium]|nr:bifunctional demethylmenaquinone methyltransferase/2-methoxy-6-polyprenyl-1,4-benzoquinol methylase UbiE [bacterium]MDW8321106.1 bifunctional demethylmenaquinone methyltransferase/2-methoxy-6-polyprenyl-1,4-benzoquinol methylase UbiE [Armatimonadota bacterium]